MALSETFKRPHKGDFYLVKMEILIIDKDFHQEQAEKPVLKKQ